VTLQARYADPSALRKALEERLRGQSLQTGAALDRLRKEAALQRLLARLAAAAPPQAWALKGGLLMLARVSQQARATADADATWRIDQDAVRGILEDAAELDLSDGLEFLIGKPRPLRAEGPEGGLRVPVDARMAGRRFEQLRVDLNLMPGDPRPVEFVELRNLFDFAGIPPVRVPAVRAEQQLAEKLHAYTRDYGTQLNSRAKDLFDMLVIAERLRLPDRVGMESACRQTFALRQTSWPPEVAAPPVEWAGPWAGFVADYGVRFVDLPAAFTALRDFWLPVLNDGPALVWDPDIWAWTPN
jgi:hypothetical protein